MTKTRTIICKNDDLKDFATLKYVFCCGMNEFCRDFGHYPNIVYMGLRELYLLETSPEYSNSLRYGVSTNTKSRNPRRRFQGMNLRLMLTDGMKLQLYKK